MASERQELHGELPAIPAIRSSKSGGTSAHDLSLADKFGVEFGAVESEVNVKVNAVKSALRCVHALKVLFKVLAAEVRGEGNNFLDAWILRVSTRLLPGGV